LKIIKDAIKSFIKKIILEIHDEQNFKPIFDKIVIQEKIANEKYDIFDIMLKYPVKEISVIISNKDKDTGIDIGNTHKTFKTPSDFLHFLKTFKDVDYLFYGFCVTVYFDLNKKEINKTLIVLNQFDNKNYRIEEIHKYFKPIIDWFDEHPELII